MEDVSLMTIPESVGRRADLYAEIRALRLQMAKEVEDVQAFETKIRGSLIADLAQAKEAGGDTGAAGVKYRVQLVSKEKPRIVDWGALTAWIRKNDRFDLLEKRLSSKAAMDFAENENRDVPGTERVLIPDVSITKI